MAICEAGSTMSHSESRSISTVDRMKKRKGLHLQHLHLDFPSVHLSSSSRKSRRLDAELCTIMEEDEEQVPNSNVMMVHEEDPAPPAHVAASPSFDERALVLYHPTNTRLVKSPTSPDFSIVIKPDLIPGLKGVGEVIDAPYSVDYLLSWGIEKPENTQEDEIKREKSTEAPNDCLAVVPWVAFSSPKPSEETVPETNHLLEVEEGEMMEMDEPYVNNSTENAMEIGEKMETVGSPSPRQQQHCMMLNVSQNASTPIRWC